MGSLLGRIQDAARAWTEETDADGAGLGGGRSKAAGRLAAALATGAARGARGAVLPASCVPSLGLGYVRR
jgi:hypothetical protein